MEPAGASGGRDGSHPDMYDGDREAFIGNDEDGVDGEVLADLEGEGMDASSSDDGDGGAGEADEAGPGCEAMGEVEDDSMQCFEGHQDAVLAVACHPSRPDLVASGGQDDCAFVWQVGQDAYEATAGSMGTAKLAGHTDSVVSLAFSAGGTLLATASLDATVRVWDVAAGTLLRTLEGPGEGVEWVRWHPKGDVVLAGSEDFSMWMWLAAPGTCMQVFSGHAGPVVAGGFTPDGRAVVSAGGEGDVSLRVWNPKTGECTATVQGHTFHAEPPTCLGMQPEGLVAVTGAVDGSLRVSSLASGRVVAAPTEAHADSVEAAGFSPAASALAASASIDGKLLVWDAATFSQRGVCQHPEGVTALAWHPAQPLVASACMDGRVRVWDLRTAAAVREWGGHTAAVQDVAFSCDGASVLSGGDDGLARVFQL